MLRARRARAKGRKQRDTRIKRLLTPPGAGLPAARRHGAQSFLAGAGPVESAGRHHLVAAHRGTRRTARSCSPTAGVLQRIFGDPACCSSWRSLVTLVAERSLLGGARLGGGALVPVVGGASDLWRLYTEGLPPDGSRAATAWAPP